MSKIMNELEMAKIFMEEVRKNKQEEIQMVKTIKLYTDGACRGNGELNNLGAFAYRLEYGKHVKEGSWTKANTTNNEMELAAVVAGLNAIKTTNIPIEVIIDSAYVYGCAVTWIEAWRAKDYTKKGGLKNRGLIIALDTLVQKQENITFTVVKGHNGHPGNERVDVLCNIAMDKFLSV